MWLAKTKQIFKYFLMSMTPWGLVGLESIGKDKWLGFNQNKIAKVVNDGDEEIITRFGRQGSFDVSDAWLAGHAVDDDRTDSNGVAVHVLVGRDGGCVVRTEMPKQGVSGFESWR